MSQSLVVDEKYDLIKEMYETSLHSTFAESIIIRALIAEFTVLIFLDQILLCSPDHHSQPIIPQHTHL